MHSSLLTIILKNIRVTKVLFMVVIVMINSACTSTKVHLYSRYLSESVRVELTQQLQEKGFEVVNNTYRFPDDIHQSSLIYAPYMAQQDSVALLLKQLKTLGWTSIYQQVFASGNHYYVNNSVGLLLLPPGESKPDNNSVEALSQHYQAKKCHYDMSLILNSDSTYSFVGPDSEGLKNLGFTAGQWKITQYPYIEMVSEDEDWRFYYKIKHSSSTDMISHVKVISLSPFEHNSKLPQCKFEYGLRL